MRWIELLRKATSSTARQEAEKEEVLAVFRALARESRNQGGVREYVPSNQSFLRSKGGMLQQQICESLHKPQIVSYLMDRAGLLAVAGKPTPNLNERPQKPKSAIDLKNYVPIIIPY